MKHKSSGPKYDRISSRISSGRSFSVVGLLAIVDGLENTYFLFQNGTKLMLSAPDVIQVQNYSKGNISCINYNLNIELLGRSELPVQCTNAFN